MIALALSSTGCALALCGLTGQLTHRIRTHHAHGLMAVSYLLYLTAALLQHHHTRAVFWAAGLAWFTWLWWHNGGSDGTRRRLREWRRRFEGVRRTAPATA